MGDEKTIDNFAGFEKSAPNQGFRQLSFLESTRYVVISVHDFVITGDGFSSREKKPDAGVRRAHGQNLYYALIARASSL
jgi:hypothetical protein